MKHQKFNISNRPLLEYDGVAYLVDYKNVELHRQYIERYYQRNEVNWFYREFMKPMLKNKKYSLILYYGTRSLRYDYELDEIYTLYYITNNMLMTVE